MIGIIYSVTNKQNQMTYIGQTIRSLKVRKQIHFNNAGYGNRCIFSNAIREYGEDNFLWDVIAIYEHENIQKLKSMLDKAEMYYINAYDTFHTGYNMTEGGEGCVGYKHTKEVKQILSEQKIGEKNPMYGVTGEKHPAYGYKHTKETKQKMSENHPDVSGKNHPMYGKYYTEEAKQKMSETTKGENSYWYGKKHTEEHNQKISEALKCYWQNKKNL